MKKHRKLALARETLRRLDDQDLMVVVGGTSTLTLLCPPTQPQTRCLVHSLACEV